MPFPARSLGAARRAAPPAIDLDAVGVQALGFLAADPERLADFLALTGLTVGGVRAASAEPGFLRGVLAYLANDEALLVAFAAGHALDPERLSQAIAAQSRAGDAA